MFVVDVVRDVLSELLVAGNDNRMVASGCWQEPFLFSFIVSEAQKH